MYKLKELCLIACLGIALLLVGCAPIQSRITDETLNKIALCTGGIGESLGIDTKAQAEIDKEKKKGLGQVTIDYHDLIKGAIFSDAGLTSEQKTGIYNKYLACIDRYAGPPSKVLDITKAYVLDETQLKNGTGASGLNEIRPRDSYQYDYKTPDQIKIVLLLEVQNFGTDGVNTKLEGTVKIVNANKVIATATIPGIYTASEWLKRPVVVATGTTKVKEYLGYGDDYLGKKIPYLMVIEDLQQSEVINGSNDIVINIDDGITNQKYTKTLHVQFKKVDM